MNGTLEFGWWPHGAANRATTPHLTMHTHTHVHTIIIIFNLHTYTYIIYIEKQLIPSQPLAGFLCVEKFWTNTSVCTWRNKQTYTNHTYMLNTATIYFCFEKHKLIWFTKFTGIIICVCTYMCDADAGQIICDGE